MFGRKTKCEVLVVGAGPVGLFAALQLARRGVEVEIIDSQWRTAARSYALALHSRTLELFEEAGLLEPLLEQGRRIETVGFCDRDGRLAGLDFGQLENPYPYVLVTPQNLLEEGLEKRLEEEGVSVRWSHRLAGLDLGESSLTASVHRLGKDSTGYSVSSTEWVVEKSLSLEARFVLGADGHRSAVRRLAGIELESQKESQQFAVFECSSDQDPGNEMQVILEEERASVFWPLPGKRFRWSFELTEAGEAKERVKQRLSVQIGEQSFPYLTPESLSSFLTERAPWFDSSVDEMHWSVGVRFDRQCAREFGRGLVSLLGDAAHLAGPIGVQSMNSGLADASGLAGPVAQLVKEGGSNESVEAFDSRRATDWRRLSRGDASGTGAAAAWVQARADRIPACVPALGQDLDRLLAQLKLE